jgi:IS5 family transposase
MSLRPNDARMESRRYKRHIKLTLAVDVGSQTIVSLITSPGPDADFQHFRPVLEKAVVQGFSVAAVLADRGYDSESNRRFVVHELGAETHIPLRKVDRKACDHHGLYRRRQLAVFDSSLYRRRSLVETVNSVLKRTMSSRALARSERTQRIELALRAIAHNARRAAELLD